MQIRNLSLSEKLRQARHKGPKTRKAKGLIQALRANRGRKR